MVEKNQSKELQSLIAKIAMGDRMAFRSLYELSSPNLYGVLIKLLKESELAEDALQETFVQLWTKAKQYRPDRGEPMTWLHSIARYRAIDLMRRRQRDSEHADIDDAELSDSVSLLRESARDADSGLLQCMELLDEPQRKVIIQCYCEGYTHHELSKALATPLGTVKSWIRRGLLALRECLER